MIDILIDAKISIILYLTNKMQIRLITSELYVVSNSKNLQMLNATENMTKAEIEKLPAQ